MSDPAYHAAWHQANRARRMPMIREAKRLRKAASRQRLRDLKEALPCADCGESYRYFVMQFDHLGDKEGEIANLIQRGWSWKRVLTEIAKCELVCANCHAARTFARRGAC